MAINPPSDIVLDVARAADPIQYSAAVEKLTRVGRTASAQADAFSQLLNIDAPSAGPATAGLSFDPLAADLRGRLDTLSGSGKAPEPLQRFESFVLQSFVQSMLPKDAESTFGEGLAGDMWSSMLAEQIAAQMAEAGGVGIAEQIAAAHPDMAVVAEASRAPADAFSREGPGAAASATLAAAPGFVASMELDFADALMPGRQTLAERDAAAEG